MQEGTHGAKDIRYCILRRIFVIDEQSVFFMYIQLCILEYTHATVYTVGFEGFTVHSFGVFIIANYTREAYFSRKCCVYSNIRLIIC